MVTNASDAQNVILTVKHTFDVRSRWYTRPSYWQHSHLSTCSTMIPKTCILEENQCQWTAARRWQLASCWHAASLLSVRSFIRGPQRRWLPRHVHRLVTVQRTWGYRPPAIQRPAICNRCQQALTSWLQAVNSDFFYAWIQATVLQLVKCCNPPASEDFSNAQCNSD